MRIASVLSWLTLSIAVAAPAHGDDAAPPTSVYYGDLSLHSTYVTPRGLVVRDQGLTLKTLFGGLFELDREEEGPLDTLSLNVGAYTNFLSAPTSLPRADGTRTDGNNIFDFDPYLGFEALMYEKWKVSTTYIAFLNPSGFYDAVHNAIFSVGYNDSELLGAFSIQPYVRSFTTMSGDSPALVGRTPATYVELGGAPRLPIPGSLGLILSMPTAVFLAEPDFYGKSGPLGTVSTSLILSKQVGAFTVRAGVEYFYLANDNLRVASSLLGNGTEASRWIGTVGVSFAFPGC